MTTISFPSTVNVSILVGAGVGDVDGAFVDGAFVGGDDEGDADGTSVGGAVVGDAEGGQVSRPVHSRPTRRAAG